MTTDDLFEHLEKYYGRKEREPYYFCYCIYLYVQRLEKLNEILKLNSKL